MLKKEEKFIIDVVPLTKIPLTTSQSFSYLHATRLPIGTLVNVPLFRRKVEGIVVGSRNDFHRLGSIELRKIESIIEEKFLDKNQIELAKFISDYYITPLGKVLSSFIPKRVKARNAKIKIRLLDSKQPIETTKKITLTPEQKKAVSSITKNNDNQTKFLLFGPAGAGKTEVYIHSILKLAARSSQLQFLVLVPEQTLTPQAIERYGEYFKPGEIVILSSNLSKGQFYSNWQAIKSGQAKIIIGTRMAVFAPFKKLSLIVIDEEQDVSYKQWDMSPRYDARTVAEKLSKVFKCSLVRGSATPNIESYFKAQAKDYVLLKLPELKISNTYPRKQNTELVDMKKERWQKNKSCISKKLKAEIAYALKHKLQTILFINRQGMSSFSVCSNCRTVMRCPTCERALIYDLSGSYHCSRCTHKTSIIPECFGCHGLKFENVGLGTQKVEKEVATFFPTAHIARVDSQTAKSPYFQEKVYREFSEQKIDILIGTQMISKGWDLPNVALVGIIDTDNMLTIPDFAAAEKAYQNIVQVSGRTARPGAKYPGTIVIQTFQNENWLLKTIAERNFEKFYGHEIEERKALSYPPFSRLIKLVYQDYSKEKTEKEAARVYNLIFDVEKIKVFESQEAFIPKIRGRYRQQIVIKIPASENVPKKLVQKIHSLPSGWIIDVDPISLT